MIDLFERTLWISLLISFFMLGRAYQLLKVVAHCIDCKKK